MQKDAVAEWLRRWTANPLGSARVGWNPSFVVVFIFHWLYIYLPYRRLLILFHNLPRSAKAQTEAEKNLLTNKLRNNFNCCNYIELIILYCVSSVQIDIQNQITLTVEYYLNSLKSRFTNRIKSYTITPVQITKCPYLFNISL